MKTPWYPCYPQDFIGSMDCRLMTLAEFGLFNWLLMYGWNNEMKPCYLENNPKNLSRIIGQPLKAFLTAWIGVQKKFELWIDPKTQIEYFFNRRLYIEYNKRLATFNKQSDRSQKAHASRWGTPEPEACNEHATSMPKAGVSRHAPLQSQSQLQSEGNLSVVSLSAKPKRTAKTKTDPPENFEVSENMRQWAEREGFDEATIERETPAMLDYWRSKGEQKSDWIATWRNWLRNSRRFNAKGNGNGQANESREQAKVRRTIEAAREASDFLDGHASAGSWGGDHEGASNPVPQAAIGPYRPAD